MADIISLLRQGLGNAVDVAGTYGQFSEIPGVGNLFKKDYNVSEWLAGGDTLYTKKPVQATGTSQPVGPQPVGVKQYNQPAGPSYNGPQTPGSEGRSPVVNNNGNISTGGPGGEDQAKNQYFSYLDQQAGNLGNVQRTLEEQIGSLFGSQQSSINTAAQNQIGDLNLSKQKAETNKANSLRDLEKDMRSQLSAGQRYLGSIPGASSSSAAGMYNYALGKVGSQNRANLQQQANEIFSTIGTNIDKVKTTAQDQMQQLETWKSTELSKIAQYIQSLRGQIDQQKANYIQNQLLNVDQQVNSYKQGIAQWAMNNAQNLEQLKSYMGQLGVNVGDFQQGSFPGMTVAGGPSAGGVQLFGKRSEDKKV